MPNTNATLEQLAAGTRVLNTEDGEPGFIMNGFTFDPANGGWTEYEVETNYGVEVWRRDAFMAPGGTHRLRTDGR